MCVRETVSVRRWTTVPDHVAILEAGGHSSPSRDRPGNYSLRRSISVWLRLFSSFSLQPLRIVTFCGLTLAVAGLVGAMALVVYRLSEPAHFYGPATGWASLMIVILVIGGVQMVFLGVLGEYIGRTYLQVNRKPQALVKETLNLPERVGS